jgi:uncharacterized protein (UPF0332 family)
MTLRELLNEGRIRPHRPSAKEIHDLLDVVARDLADAEIEDLSCDRRFATAYNAVLQLATILLYASGYRTSGTAQHWTTFQALPHVMGSGEQERSDYLDSCRRKRNIAEYDSAGMISEGEVAEILREARLFHQAVLEWLKKNHPDLLRS